VAGLLASGYRPQSGADLLQVISLWLLLDPILGTLWEVTVQHGLWRKIWRATLPPPQRHGFYLPYAQPGSAGADFVLKVRRYQLWWREYYWPQNGPDFTAFGFGLGLALLIAFYLSPTILGLTGLALGLIGLAGHSPADLSTAGGGRLQSLVQFLIPWACGVTWGGALTPLTLLFGLCYWVTYLGGLRMLGRHRRADLLFWLGQIAALALLLALRYLPGAALLAIMLVVQQLIKEKLVEPERFLARLQPYLIVSLLAAGYALGYS
jgi:hypothetical protein